MRAIGRNECAERGINTTEEDEQYAKAFADGRWEGEADHEEENDGLETGDMRTEIVCEGQEESPVLGAEEHSVRSFLDLSQCISEWLGAKGKNQRTC